MPRGRPLRPHPLLAIYTIIMAVKYNAVSLGHKHSPKILFIHINQCIYIVLALTGNARQSIMHLKYFYHKNFIFEILFFRILFCLI